MCLSGNEVREGKLVIFIAKPIFALDGMDLHNLMEN